MPGITPPPNPLMPYICAAMRKVTESGEGGGARVREPLWLHQVGGHILTAIVQALPAHPSLRLWETVLRDRPMPAGWGPEAAPPEDAISVRYLRVGPTFIGVSTDYIGLALLPSIITHEEGAIQRALSSVSGLALPQQWRVYGRWTTHFPDVPEGMRQPIGEVFATPEAQEAFRRAMAIVQDYPTNQ